MSHLSNAPDQKQGYFKPRVQPTAPNTQPFGPLADDKHDIGTKTGPKDSKPEFHAETYPPGTAPASNSFTPNQVGNPGSQALNPDVERSHGKESTKTSASQTLTGATSQDVHKGFGHPGSGQSSTEIRHDGQHHRKNQPSGIEGLPSYWETRIEQKLAKKPTMAEGRHAQ